LKYWHGVDKHEHCEDDEMKPGKSFREPFIVTSETPETVERGINMGTRFVATHEAPVHQKVKQAILAATELDTRLVMRPLRNTERVLNNAGVERLLEKERRLGADIAFSDIADEVGGVYPRVMKDGYLDAGAWSCGMVAGLIHDIPKVGELIQRIMHQAEEIVAKRLHGMLSQA
jgi:nitronate monooxygenase